MPFNNLQRSVYIFEVLFILQTLAVALKHQHSRAGSSTVGALQTVEQGALSQKADLAAEQLVVDLFSEVTCTLVPCTITVAVAM